MILHSLRTELSGEDPLSEACIPAGTLEVSVTPGQPPCRDAKTQPTGMKMEPEGVPAPLLWGHVEKTIWAHGVPVLSGTHADPL